MTKKQTLINTAKKMIKGLPLVEKPHNDDPTKLDKWLLSKQIHYTLLRVAHSKPLRHVPPNFPLEITIFLEAYVNETGTPMRRHGYRILPKPQTQHPTIGVK